MNIHDILSLPVFEKASVIAGSNHITGISVTGIMVLEALDVENWAHEGEIILSSYYALESLSSSEVLLFIQKLTDLKIAALIIKLERLLKNIPEDLVQACNDYHIPLITISNDLSYETIMIEVLRPIINTNAASLNQYYLMHQKLAHLMLSEPSIQKLLEELKKNLHYDVTLVTNHNSSILGTNPLLDHFKVHQKKQITASTYQIFQRYLMQISYASTGLSASPVTSTAIFIPGSEETAAFLYIHADPQNLDHVFFPIIENFVFFLQTELLKQQAIRRNLFLQTNEFIYNLLKRKAYDSETTGNILRNLHLTQYDFYQILTLQSLVQEPPGIHTPFDATLTYRFFRDFCHEFRKRTPYFSYGISGNQMVLICNIPNRAGCITSKEAASLSEIVCQTITQPDYPFQIALSSVKQSNELTQGYQETLDILKILDYKKDQQSVCSYGELGIYRLFLKSNILNNIESLIPPELLAFHQRYPDLSATLHCYLIHNQNISETAAAMFLHPKTIHYRLNRIRSLLSYNLKDNASVIEIQLAYYALDLQKENLSYDN